jgi:hypothetical protein
MQKGKVALKIMYEKYGFLNLYHIIIYQNSNQIYWHIQWKNSNESIENKIYQTKLKTKFKFGIIKKFKQN